MPGNLRHILLGNIKSLPKSNQTLLRKQVVDLLKHFALQQHDDGSVQARNLGVRALHELPIIAAAGCLVSLTPVSGQSKYTKMMVMTLPLMTQSQKNLVSTMIVSISQVRKKAEKCKASHHPTTSYREAGTKSPDDELTDGVRRRLNEAAGDGGDVAQDDGPAASDVEGEEHDDHGGHAGGEIVGGGDHGDDQGLVEEDTSEDPGVVCGRSGINLLNCLRSSSGGLGQSWQGLIRKGGARPYIMKLVPHIIFKRWESLRPLRLRRAIPSREV